jgi:hypothetical protein
LIDGQEVVASRTHAPLLERIAAVRLTAVRRLRDDGWSYDRIAAATGLSKGRVQQLSNLSR